MLELETDRPIDALRSPFLWAGIRGPKLLFRELVQVQVNVIRPKGDKRRAAR